MHALSYEWRRLAGVRSTWLILVAVLIADFAVSAVTVRHALGGPGTEPVRVLTAAVPLLPLPLAALGAGAVGALSLGQEFSHPALGPLTVPLLRRLCVLLAKLALVAAYALVLGGATEAGGLVLLRYLRPASAGTAQGTADSRALDSQALVRSLAHGSAPLHLAGYLALAVAAGWIGLLAAGLLRGAAAGMLAVLVVPVLAQPLVHYAAHARSWQALLPFGSGRGWLFGQLSGIHLVHALPLFEVGAAAAAPVALLLVGYVALLCGRRSL